MLSTSTRCSRFAATTTIMVASISNVTAFSTATSRLTSILSDPSLIACNSPPTPTETYFDVVDPGASTADFNDGTAIIARIRRMGRDDTRASIDRASEALPDWRDKTTAAKRSKILSEWSSLIKESSEDISKIMTLESGKPLAESRGEVNYGTSFLDYYAAECIRPNSAGGGFLTPSPFATPDGAPRGKMMAINEAVGVCGLITPWNFPIAMITRKVGPALAAGCTIVLKPSELTPLTAIALKTLAKRAGVPDGVFELVTADRDLTREVGEEMTGNSIIKKISFTGSTPVGKLLMKQSSDTVKRISLELGGNASFIVFEDADLDVAINAAMASKFRNAGQTCVCSDRFIVHKSIEEEFVSRLTQRVEQIKIGHGLEDGVTMGPVISDVPVKNLTKKVEAAINEGANCVIGGSPLVDKGPFFFECTILTNVSSNSLIWTTENFGPVAAVTTFETEEEAVAMANDSSVGLAAYVCTTDVSRIFRVSSALEVGMVGVNEGIISNASAPFGGVKESGLGREGSALGLNEYLNTKYVFLNC